ncbi:type VI secretion system-associated FHA domain protein TagH [Tropicimonas sp. IMCC6043]|uniref:type VI secretion system-associated FHA domain protein TagH n=1 Tax=Tropicimonas sp. IMCC6043 TaxID=2510645 RepID=UPI00352DCE53
MSMVGNSLTIGRGNNNDLVLPDPDRVISSNHCAIEDQNGNVVVIDLSTNGTFLNYGKIPLGRVPTPLNDGDILSIGGYELAVQISSGKPEGPQLLDPVASANIAPSGAKIDTDLDGLLDAPSSGRGTDVINDLLDAPGDPVGPKGVKRPELGEDGLLPPLGDDEIDDPLAQGPSIDDQIGSSQHMHNPSMVDHMPLPQVSSSTIPDDWDLDLPASPLGSEPDTTPSEPDTTPEDPFSEIGPSEPAGGIESGKAFIPEDLDFDLGEPSSPPAAEPKPPEPPSPEPEAPQDPLEALTEAEDLPLTPEPAPSPAEARPPAPPPQPASPLPGAAAGVPEAQVKALRTLLDAAGVGEIEIAENEIQETAARIGNVLRVMIHGMREILMTRTSIKSEFRIDQTRISASGNNPLKFSVTPEQAVEVMVSAPKRGYLSAEAAAEQALQDIKAHEVATMTGMEAALKGVLKRLSPETLEAEISDAGGLGNLLKGKKARYWETYERIYADVADAAENDFHELFSREFARAYQEQLNKLKDGQ